LHIVDDTVLDVSFVSQIHMQVGHRGLEVIMPQAIFDIRSREASGKHVDRTGVAKAVNGIDRSKALKRQSQVEVFSAKAINAVAGEFFPALIDKEALLIRWFWGWPESRDVELKEMSGFGFQLDEAEAVAFSEDGQGFLLGVKVVQVESGHFRGPGT
jgi:hypothetical protein